MKQYIDRVENCIFKWTLGLISKLELRLRFIMKTGSLSLTVI